MIYLNRTIERINYPIFLHAMLRVGKELHRSIVPRRRRRQYLHYQIGRSMDAVLLNDVGIADNHCVGNELILITQMDVYLSERLTLFALQTSFKTANDIVGD